MSEKPLPLPNPFTHPPKIFSEGELRKWNRSFINSRNAQSRAAQMAKAGHVPVRLKNTLPRNKA
jgi:hypothetical protein